MMNRSRSDAVHVHAYTALEALRVAIPLIEASCPDVRSLAALDIVEASLRERVSAARLSVCPQTFAMIRQHRNQNHENDTGTEGASLALALCIRELNRAIDLMNKDDSVDGDDPLYRLVLGSYSICETERAFFEFAITGFDEEAALEAVCQGRPVPPYDKIAMLERIIVGDGVLA